MRGPGRPTPRRSRPTRCNNPGTMNAMINTARGRRSPAKRSPAGARPPRARQARELLVRAGARQQVLAARHGDRNGPPHPEGRRGLDRRAGRDPARVLQHRLLLGTVLGQPPHRPAPARSERAQFRPDAVRHRPVPARLPQFPGHRGPSAERARLLPVREGGRRTDLATARANPCASSGPTRPTPTSTWNATSTRRSERTPWRAAARSSPPPARAATRRFPKPQGAVQEPSISAPSTGQDRPARRLAGQRTSRSPATEVGTDRCRALHSNHMPGHVWQEFGSETLRLRPPDRQHQGAARRRPRLLPQRLAAQSAGRTRRSCTTTRSARNCAASRRTGTTTSTGRLTSMPAGRRCHPTSSRRAGPTTRPSRAASSCMSRR